MKFCKNCNKQIEPREETFKDLCIDCYNKYLYQKISEMAEEEAKNSKSSLRIFFEKIISFLKK